MSNEYVNQYITNVKQNKMVKLDLSNLGLTEIPYEVFELTNLEQLYINNNSINNIPAEISRLTNLVDINLSNNCVTSVPNELCKLSELQRINLSHNMLTNIPNMYDFSSLRYLYINNNQIRELPILPSCLEQISIQNTCITHVPISLINYIISGYLCMLH